MKYQFKKINDVKQINKGKMVENLVNEINNITLIWKYQITNCNVMFKDLNNIIYIDLSEFDASSVTDMTEMFENCILLVS